MSNFLSYKYEKIKPYTPGEQPRDMKYIKLNTNENPFPPSKKGMTMAIDEINKLNLYSDPTCKALNEVMAKEYDVLEENILMTNGSDEILNFAFMAYCDEKTGAAFPDITYGFYKVFAELYNISYQEIALLDDFSINISDYFNIGKTIFIANPNAPTGMILSLSQIEEILKNNPNNIVVIDEAYIDFGGKSAISLINKYKNLLVTGTFSKSRSMAGARLGMGFACKEIIDDLNKIKYSTNPYNVNKLTMAAGVGTILDKEYTKKNCQEIIKNREFTEEKLKKLGFSFPKSYANFIFAKHNKIGGEALYQKLKDNGILVRHLSGERITDYNRITIGTMEQMEKLIEVTSKILEGIL